jgi:hypothetical protein
MKASMTFEAVHPGCFVLMLSVEKGQKDVRGKGNGGKGGNALLDDGRSRGRKDSRLEFR